MNRHCRQQEQKGQSTVEYAGAAFVVAAIIATIATLIAAGSGVSLAQAVVCKISSAIHSVGGADDSYSCDYSQNQGQETNDPRKVDPGSIPSQSEERTASTSVGVSIPLPGPGSANVGGKDGTSVTKTTYMDNSGERQYSSTQSGTKSAHPLMIKEEARTRGRAIPSAPRSMRQQEFQSVIPQLKPITATPLTIFPAKSSTSRMRRTPRITSTIKA